MPEFVHLHSHTQFSLLDGASGIPELMQKAAADGMKGVAMTDHGNMFGAYKFILEAEKQNIKPVIGCEFYLVENRHKKEFANARGERDKRYHQLLLAKNKTGYHNLAKLCSIGFIEGLYSKYPRIDKEILVQYTEGVIATSCCIGAEIPQHIAQGKIEEAEELLKWWLDLFGQDFYIELQRQKGMEKIDGSNMSQEQVNQQLLVFARKYNIKVIATNDAHYVDQEDSLPHDILLCVNTNSKLNDLDRFKFSSNDFYFKTQTEMGRVFADLPEALDNTAEILDQVESYSLKSDVLMPNFPIPEGFVDQMDYLRHLVFQGAKERYSDVDILIKDRLEFELATIAKMNYPGYFLVVQDFINAAREIGVAVGPGRGSAAGSAVAYCLKITNIDPIKYNLLFERFLNPDRISMPDIDIDFDDVGRQQVIDYVVKKYGQNQVAQIVTFGTMAAKSSIRDVARVMDIPLSDADRISKLVPTKPGVKLKDILLRPLSEVSQDWDKDEMSRITQLRDIFNKDDQEGAMVKLAVKLEGSVRNTGTHAAGVIIAPDDISKYIPVCTTKDAELVVTQFDGSLVEEAGMLKMDFLGLKTLSIIRDSIKNIVLRHGEGASINPDTVPLDDELTYKLFQNGEMVGIFQFESDGMQKYLKELKPTNIEDLIAMNALFRPGPMDNIPSYIRRKHGKEKVEYPHPLLEKVLEPTFGIMVYQEQIMECARVVANFTLAKADLLRRIMGKKKAEQMDEQRALFVVGAAANDIPESQANEIFDTMSKFASYGFNRSHAAAYSVLAFQTAYLKAHFPAEFMAAVLTHNKNNLENIYFFLKEAKRMGIQVAGPDVNESQLDFTVNKVGTIRFGLSALKGVGEGPVENLMEERIKSGDFNSLVDMVKRLNLRTMNKRCLDSLVLGGALDSFKDVCRAQYFGISGKHETYIEACLKFGSVFQSRKESAVVSLFGDADEDFMSEPEIPNSSPWTLIETLEKEREMTGIYLSGHPLDDYKSEVENFTNSTLLKLAEPRQGKLKLAAVVTDVKRKVDKKGNDMGNFTLLDYSGSYELVMFREDFQKFHHILAAGNVVYLEAVMQQRYMSEEYILVIKEAKLLADVAQHMTETLTIRLRVEDLDDIMFQYLDKTFNRKTGKQKLKFLISDPGQGLEILMNSNERKANVDTEFLSELDKKGLLYTLS